MVIFCDSPYRMSAKFSKPSIFSMTEISNEVVVNNQGTVHPRPKNLILPKSLIQVKWYTLAKFGKNIFQVHVVSMPQTLPLIWEICIILWTASKAGSLMNRLGSGQRRDTDQGYGPS